MVVTINSVISWVLTLRSLERAGHIISVFSVRREWRKKPASSACPARGQYIPPKCQAISELYSIAFYLLFFYAPLRTQPMFHGAFKKLMLQQLFCTPSLSLIFQQAPGMMQEGSMSLIKVLSNEKVYYSLFHRTQLYQKINSNNSFQSPNNNYQYIPQRYTNLIYTNTIHTNILSHL